MNRVTLKAGMLCVLLSNQAIAQQQTNQTTLEELNKRLQEQMKEVPPGFTETMLAEIHISLAGLLNNKWSIITGTLDTGFVLRNGDKWVACRLTDGLPTSGRPPSSRCLALN